MTRFFALLAFIAMTFPAWGNAVGYNYGQLGDERSTALHLFDLVLNTIQEAFAWIAS